MLYIFLHTTERVNQHSITPRIRAETSTVIPHFSVPWRSASKIVARCVQAALWNVEIQLDVVFWKHCAEPQEDEEKELQEKEDESYVRGRVA